MDLNNGGLYIKVIIPKPKHEVGMHVVVAAPNASGRGVIVRVRDVISAIHGHPPNKFKYDVECQYRVEKSVMDSSRKVVFYKKESKMINGIKEEYISVDKAYYLDAMVKKYGQ
jgi:hypothetical protein